MAVLSLISITNAVPQEILTEIMHVAGVMVELKQIKSDWQSSANQHNYRLETEFKTERVDRANYHIFNLFELVGDRPKGLACVAVEVDDPLIPAQFRSDISIVGADLSIHG